MGTPMSSWVPGYDLLEGPEQTGVPLRYRARRVSDGAAAWIRVDGFDAGSREAAVAVDALYAATASFDHPLLPAVLDTGSTEVEGRSFIAFQTSEPSPGGGHRTRRGTMTALAEVQIAALECGFSGVHLPMHELLRLRDGSRLEARHLPVHEFLCEPAGTGLAALEAWSEANPFLPPEVAAGARGVSPRASLAYRLAAQFHVILEGRAPGAASAGDADKTIAISALPSPARAGPAADVPRELVRLGLSLVPGDRPDPSYFLAFRLPSGPG